MSRQIAWLATVPLTLALSCAGGEATGGGSPTGGATATGGTGGATSGGQADEGGRATTGGNANKGGSATTGGNASTGGSGGKSGPSTTGGSAGKGGSPSTGGNSATGGSATAGTGGASTTGGVTGNCAGNCVSAAAGACSAPQVRVTAINVGSAVNFSTDETGVLPLAIAAKPGGGSRIAWMTGYGSNTSSKSSVVHIGELDCEDKLVGTPFTLPAHDFQDLVADGNGGVIMLTRDAEGGGTLNCGTPSSLCGTPPNPPIACYNMFMVRYDCAGAEQWATKLTTSNATNVPYSSGGGTNYMVWWYQHQGRIATDGTNYAGFFCDGIVVQNGSCVDIHEGDRMQVVGPTGTLLTGHNSFGTGCSHSGFTRIIWDPAANRFAMVCKTDNNNRIAQPNPYSTVLPVTLDGSFVGDLVLAKGGGYWLTVSNAGSVHLLHFNQGMQADQDKNLGNANYPHLVAYGANNMIAIWASSLTGNMTGQVFDTSGNQVSPTFPIAAPGHPYQSFKAFPDGSAAYAGVGSSSATIQIARVMPCSG